MSKSLFTGKLSNGVEIELLEAESFSGKTEFAIKVASEVSSVSSVNVIRNGDIQVKTSSKNIRIKSILQTSATSGSSAATAGTKPPTLTDVK